MGSLCQKGTQMKVLIGMPTANEVDAEFACANLPGIVAYTIKHCPDIDLKCMYKCGVRTDSNRNYILSEALKAGIDYILWLDTDMLYPLNIVEKLLEADKDVIGTIYYKRSAPYSPVVYKLSDNPNFPYRPIDTPYIPKGKVVEVDGLGFGGMMVKTSVYEAMGDDKWVSYGKNFHIPLELPDKESHDLMFCKLAKQYGFKLYVHSSIIAKHIGRIAVTERDYFEHLEHVLNPKIAVLMPAIDIPKAQETMKKLIDTAGMNAEYVMLEDTHRQGFVAMANQGFNMYRDYEYFVYLAQDAEPEQDWLKIAFDTMRETNAGLLAFNDGKWNGRLASFGMVRKSWVTQFYDGIFYEGYKSHYCDTELSVLAQAQGKMIYNPNAVLKENDPNKKQHGVNLDDKKLYNERKRGGMPIKLPIELQELFS